MELSRREFVAASVAAASAYGAQAGRYSRFDPPVRKLLATLSLDQKIGQMTQPDQMFLHSEDDIVKYHLGSLLSGGDSDPKTGNGLQSWTDLYDHYQSIALKAEPRIPLLYGIDAVHGHNNVLGSTIFPHNIGLGCTRDAKLVESIGRITAEEVRATGINWAFAPCVTVPQDIRWGRTYEGYSESPDIVKSLGGAAVRGLQRDALDHPLAVLACSKHFAGDGGTTFGTGMPKAKGSDARYPLDRGDVRVDEATLRKIHLPGHIAAVQAGVGSIMPSYSSWNGVKCSGSRRLLTEILKQELGFEGFLISDYDALNELPGDYKEQIAQSINAGMDMVMVPHAYVEFFGKLRELVTEGKVPMSRIDDAVTRILRVKFALGLMDAQRSPLADRSVQKTFGSTEHRAVARQAVRQSLVLLKNENHLLPLAKDAKLHVAGKSAHDIGNQCGGWTITWQGKSGNVIEGTTILAAIRKTGAQVTSSPDGSGTVGSGIGIAVIGETPYAEFFGDRTNLRLTVEDVVLVDTMKRAGLRVVAVVVSGRPLIIDDILDKADAIVAAWLPGTEGDGVADVLFGTYKPTGKLSFTWPSDTPKPLYALGHGLGY